MIQQLGQTNDRMEHTEENNYYRNERFPFAVLLPDHCKTGFSWTVAMQQLISVLGRRRSWAEKQTPTNINKSVDLWSCTCFNITKGILKQYDLIISTGTHSLCAWFIICRDLFMFKSMEAYSNSHAQSQAGVKISFQSSLKYWLLSVHMAGYTLHLLACRFTNRPINPPSLPPKKNCLMQKPYIKSNCVYYSIYLNLIN